MKRALAVIACAVLAPLCTGGAPALGDVFGPISLVSQGSVPGASFVQQANSANDVAVSANGRYVAFDGSFAGHSGVFRRDLLSGEVASVAEGNAALPSISADGRYVSFTTTARLDAENDHNAAPDVYVRDMDRPSFQACPEGWEESESAREECAFTLASAVNGSAVGLSYAYGTEPTEATTLGSVAAGRSALSADGRVVAFETTAASNLANPGRSGAPGVIEAALTPAPQVAVRYLDTQTTLLVSVRDDPATGGPALNQAGQPEPTPDSAEGQYGAVFPSGEHIPGFPSAYEGASLSADGSTVAWMGQQISEQAPVMRGSDLADEPKYTEPLWRRIGGGESASTRRVTGGSDPTSPQCEASGETQVSSPPSLSDPCQGPFDPTSHVNENGVWEDGTSADYLPRLSANGTIVAFLATAREIASGEELSAAGSSDDLYVVDMSGGLTRLAATRRLTELAGGSTQNEARTGPIADLDVSPDGSQVAFSSVRTIFPLGAPAYVSAPAAAAKAVELYDVDLQDDTLTRVTQGFEGQPSEFLEGTTSTTGSPSFDESGDLLAFASNSDNLVYGDGNKNSDAFVVSRRVFSSSPVASEISSAPANPAFAPAWKLEATALSRRDGTILLEVLVPGAGSLHAGAVGAVRVRVTVRAGRHAARNVRSRRAKRVRTVVETRTVSSALEHPLAATLVAVPLALAKPYGALASARGGLSANVTLSFSAGGHPPLRVSIPVTFVRTTPTPARKHTKRSKRHAVRKRRR